MQELRGRIAVVTGGGTGMGRELAKQLALEGCHVALCDVSAEHMAETRAQCETIAPSGTRITTHLCDVSEEPQVVAFRDAVCAEHETDHVHLLFNNAGIGGGGSFLMDERAEWDKTFAVCWYGVYYCTRAFLPLLVASPEAHLVNTSSVNGFWASLGPMTPHTAYSAAKFAVKGFIGGADQRPPPLRAAREGVVVMPGHVGTSIVLNSAAVLGRPSPKEMTADDLRPVRERLERQGLPVDCAQRRSARARAMQQMADGLSRQRAAQRSRRRHDHPRRRAQGPVADPGGRGCRGAGSHGARRARGGLRARVHGAAAGQGALHRCAPAGR